MHTNLWKKNTYMSYSIRTFYKTWGKLFSHILSQNDATSIDKAYNTSQAHAWKEIGNYC